MATELLLASVGAGKTEQALARIKEVTDKQPFAKVWVLLANERQIQMFRNRLIHFSPDQHIYFNVEFFNFYNLYNRILESVGYPTRNLNEPSRLRLLRVLAANLAAQGHLNLYATIASKSGFIKNLADFIYELKYSLIEPDEFLHAAQSAFGDRLKDAEFVRLYDTYQSRLRDHNVVDREGQGWLALDVLRDNAQVGSDISLVVVDGYDQFTLLQARMIALLSQQVGHTLVTLTTVPGREDTIGRRFERARQALFKAHERYDVAIYDRILAGQIEARHPDLHQLAERIFLSSAPPVWSSGGIRFLAAPDEAIEAGMVLRDVKRLLLARNPDGSPQCYPDDILIILRNYELYHTNLQAIGRAYDIPMTMHHSGPLAQSLPVNTLMTLLTLHSASVHLIEFPRRVLLDILRSPYITVAGLDDEMIEVLDQVSREFVVIGGRDTWLESILTAGNLIPSREDEEVNDTKEPIIDPEKAKKLYKILERFFDHITPPEYASVTSYIQWIDNLIGHEGLEEPDDADYDHAGYLSVMLNIRRNAPDYIVFRDLTAVSEFKRALQGLLSAQLLLNTLEGTGDMLSWEAFWTDLQTVVEHTASERRSSRSGRVLITTADNARGLPHKHIFIMGLSEGLFPMRLPEDPLYLDSERRRLQAHNIAIQTTAEQAGDDGLFYELISMARDTLTLSRPCVRNGVPWLESHLWRATAAVFADADDLIKSHEFHVGSSVSLLEAVTPSEVVVAVAEAFSKSDHDSDAVAAYNALLQANDALWRRVHIGRSVELSRLHSDTYDEYTGYITHPGLRDEIEKLLGSRHRWSASQLNDYGACPFRFFASRLLLLEALEEPKSGLDAKQLGSLNHSILEVTYTKLAQDSVEIKPENTDKALEQLEKSAEKEFADAARRFGFRASAVWEQEKQIILSRLRSLVIFDFNDMNAHLTKKYGQIVSRRPYQMEERFGIGGQGRLIRIDEDSPPVYLAGIIDRIDVVGHDALLIDYKTGTTPIPLKELQEGRNFQIMLYIMAAKDLFAAASDSDEPVPRDVRGGFFWHIRSAKTSGELDTSNSEHLSIISASQHKIVDYIQRARSGEFTVSPSQLDDGKCTKYCDYYRLCRILVTGRNKKNPH